MSIDNKKVQIKDITDNTLILTNCLSKIFLIIMYKRRNLKLKIDFIKAEIFKLNSFPPILNFSI